MKKIVLTLALAAFAFAANAQFVIGGQLGFNQEGGNMKYNGTAITGQAMEVTAPFASDGVSSTNGAIVPKIGYQLNDKMQAGLLIGIAGGTQKDFRAYANEYMTIKDFEGWTKYTYGYFVVAPYFRYNLFEFKGLNFFCEAQLALTFSGNTKIHDYRAEYTDALGLVHPTLDTTYETTDKTNQIVFSIVPGLSYKFSEKFSADLYIDLVKFSIIHNTNYESDKYAPGDTYTENTNTIRFGADLGAQTLTNQFSHFRLGFNYHF